MTIRHGRMQMVNPGGSRLAFSQATREGGVPVATFHVSRPLSHASAVCRWRSFSTLKADAGARGNMTVKVDPSPTLL